MNRLGASKDMVFVGAPLASLAGRMSMHGWNPASPLMTGSNPGSPFMTGSESVPTDVNGMRRRCTAAQSQKELAIAGMETGLSQADLAKAAGVLSETSALQVLQTRIGLLGHLASGN